MKSQRAKKSHRNFPQTPATAPAAAPEKKQDASVEVRPPVDVALEYTQSRPPGSGRREIDLFVPAQDIPASAAQRISAAYTTPDASAFRPQAAPPSRRSATQSKAHHAQPSRTAPAAQTASEHRSPAEHRAAHRSAPAEHTAPAATRRTRTPSSARTRTQQKKHMERAGDTLYDYLDGKKRLDIPKASERPGTAKAGLPRAKDTVVRPEKRPKHKKSQKTIYKQPKQVTYTDLQTAIPVKSGKGNTYPAAIREEREARRKRDERLTYLIVFCVVIFIAAAVWLVRIFIGYRMTAGEYADIRETYVVMPAAWTGNEEQEKDNDAFYPSLQINFASLYALNEDFIGWLYLPGCGISYPLVQGEDNDYYLNHTFLNTEAAGGAIFVDYTDKADFSSLNTFVYGHNMQDGSMFGSLYRYGQDASLIGSYPYFYVYLSGGSVRKYRIFSYYQDREDSQTYVRIEDESAYGEYLQMLVDKSVRLPDGSQVSDTPPTTEDTIVTLSTCHGRADSGQRFLVHGVLVGVY